MTATEQSVRIVSTYDVDDWPDTPVRYTVRTVIRPSRVEVTSVDGRVQSVRAYGWNVKKDGTTGQSWSDTSWSIGVEATPAFVSAIVAEHVAKHWGQP